VGRGTSWSKTIPGGRVREVIVPLAGAMETSNSRLIFIPSKKGTRQGVNSGQALGVLEGRINKICQQIT
jgi:hypothetical protein